MSFIDNPGLVPTPSENPVPTAPGSERVIGDQPKPRETTASKKVDDLSRHEAKHSLDPKQNPSHSPREKAPKVPRPAAHPAPGAPRK